MLQVAIIIGLPAKMKNLRSDYVALCEQLNLEPEQRVEKAIKNAE
jgi:glycine cleavage system regulatory protein